MSDPREGQPPPGTEGTAGERPVDEPGARDVQDGEQLEEATPGLAPPDDLELRVPESRPAPVAAASTGRSVGVVLGFFALLLAVAAIGGVVFTWWQVAEHRDSAAEAAADLRSLVAAADSRLAVQEQRLSTLNQEVEKRSSKLDDLDAELRQARARVESLAREEAGPERAPSLAEVEFLLLLASRELALGNNPKVALTALRQADKRLALMEDPGLSAIRAALHDELTAVEAMADVDLEGIALRLGSLARRVEGLPLRATLAPGPAAEIGDESVSGWERLRRRVGGLFADLFRVRRTDTPAAPLLTPDESFFLYRNVELDLKSARLAALSHDRANYRASLEAARSAVQAYFETSNPAVQSFIAALEELDGADIAPEWPEISRSLELLRRWEAAE